MRGCRACAACCVSAALPAGDVSLGLPAPAPGTLRPSQTTPPAAVALDGRVGDSFGLTFFGNAPLHWVPLTTDTSAFRCAATFMRPAGAGDSA